MSRALQLRAFMCSEWKKMLMFLAQLHALRLAGVSFQFLCSLLHLKPKEKFGHFNNHMQELSYKTLENSKICRLRCEMYCSTFYVSISIGREVESLNPIILFYENRAGSTFYGANTFFKEIHVYIQKRYVYRKPVFN
uniref:Uncharacterized protein n=1 Tax=Glossina pallidipes TaxID=7398 RepID=A0A1A9Z7Z8_GLOPL